MMVLPPKATSLSAPMEQRAASNASGSGSLGTMDLKDDQIQLLEENFARTKQPDASTLMLVAAECGLSEADTAQWFKQRYAKWRQAEGLPPECGSVKD
ncbi:homeodomain-only protein isoform X2 [Stegostoma tigrinum]|uniref:homeodomain-only protein isoform X2 n=1 Tax=Stegostoma tigrinum TaxID=3053191 RepID=UPI00202AE250|nr:homeodomain-only protein isoform X2 [Stegostoma tigrinum]